MDPKEQVKQLEAALEGKEAQVTSLTEQVKELGSYRQEALNAREALAASEAKAEALEAEVASAKRAASEASSTAQAAVNKQGVAQAKLDAAQKIAEGVRALL
jgi:chromosome segregation ATPase